MPQYNFGLGLSDSPSSVDVDAPSNSIETPAAGTTLGAPASAMMGQGLQSTIATAAVGCMQWVRGCLPAMNPSVHLADTYDHDRLRLTRKLAREEVVTEAVCLR